MNFHVVFCLSGLFVSDGITATCTTINHKNSAQLAPLLAKKHTTENHHRALGGIFQQTSLGEHQKNRQAIMAPLHKRHPLHIGVGPTGDLPHLGLIKHQLPADIIQSVFRQICQGAHSALQTLDWNLPSSSRYC